LTVRYDGLQQYPRKLSIKKIQDFLLIVFALCIIFFLIWLTDVIVYSMQYVLVQHDQ
jgi:capsule polysaccharide export protein KpsE/RkpR